MSIVMPVYNAQDTLAQAVESVCRQTFQDWELILVDDCSTDGSREIEYALVDGDPRIILVEKTRNGGVAESRNIGVSVASGAWVAFLDSDDVWAPKKIQRQLDAANDNQGIDIVCTGYGYINSESLLSESFFDVPASASYKTMLRKNTMSTSGVMIRRDLALSHPFDTEEHHEDLKLWLTLLKEGRICLGINEPLHYVRVGQKDSRSGNKVQAAVDRWGLYRREGIGVLRSMLYLASYAISGLKKYSSISFTEEAKHESL